MEASACLFLSPHITLLSEFQATSDTTNGGGYSSTQGPGTAEIAHSWNRHRKAIRSLRTKLIWLGVHVYVIVCTSPRPASSRPPVAMSPALNDRRLLQQQSVDHGHMTMKDSSAVVGWRAARGVRSIVAVYGTDVQYQAAEGTCEPVRWQRSQLLVEPCAMLEIDHWWMF